MMAFTLELGLAVLLLLVFGASLAARAGDRRWIAWLATAGVLTLGIVSAFVKPWARIRRSLSRTVSPAETPDVVATTRTRLTSLVPNGSLCSEVNSSLGFSAAR